LGTTDRRGFLKLLGVSGAALALPSLFTACGSSDDEDTSRPAAGASATTATGSTGAALQASSDEKIKIGFIALTDCASVVMAQELGLFKQYGLNVDVVKQASWASTRDALLTNDIQAAHMLFGMPFSVYTGVGGQAGKEIHIAMMLNHNGQAITLSSEEFAGQVGHKDIGAVSAAVEALKAKKEVTFAMTFPGGTHDMWLRYWLAAAKVDQSAVKIITVPPANMVANMKVGNMDGFCVGEPWGGVAVKDGIGFTHITTQDMWPQHPEKALGVNPEFAASRRGDLKLLMRAILEASAYIDDPKNKAEVAKVIGASAYVNAPADVIDARLAGQYNLGADLGETTYTDDTMLFSKDGLVNLPRHAHAAWYLAQYVRFGYLPELPDTAAIASKLILQDLYLEVARELSIPVPEDNMSAFTIPLDNARFDPADPAAYLRQYGGIV
jgi:nitrate/nitrite transport system substrate-binding protein